MTAAMCVRKGCRMCDVGCDHGKLAAWLVEQDLVESAIAVDVSEKSLEKAKALFSLRNLSDKAQARLGFGLTVVAPHEADDIVIAGLGFDTIQAIMQTTRWLEDEGKRLILVPSSHHARLRSWLGQQGYGIQRETAIESASHLYTVMTVGYDGVVREHDAAYAALGEVPFGGEQAQEYIDMVEKSARKILDNSESIEKCKEALEVVQAVGILHLLKEKKPEPHVG